jgi:hypothetical protein
MTASQDFSVLETVSGAHRVRAALAIAIAIAACAPAAAPPAAPSPAPAASAAAPPVPAPPPSVASAEPAAPVPPPEPAPEPTPAAPPPAESRRQSPIAMLTARDVAFLVEYANSDARQKADAECEKEAKGDLAVRGTCLTKARDKFLPDVLRFDKNAQGKLNLFIYKRSGSSLREVYIGAIEFKDETEDKVQLRFTGREKGVRPLFRGAQATISVPNDYSIEINDPELGKLTYSAKIGLVQSP